MAFRTYSYLVGREAALLTDAEWTEIAPLLEGRIRKIAEYRRTQGVSLNDARRDEPFGQQALDLYQQFTGDRLDHPDELFAVRLARYGAICPQCGKPFRTPKAKLCAACGFHLPEGKVAGPLEPGAIYGERQ